ncbi:F0F1 ATP synthase subunit B [uncultured Thioclava sp.]|uniref:ATP synthase subunit b n=1 Tax=Thioclava arctica TaxID=3238301 RepID=A0ABV3TKE0_9RHOB|nr:F0F1 ATP synthase subunit B [uncultured Thioclava sp.]
MKKLSLLFLIAAQPAFAATGPFFSIWNTNFIVMLAFLLFVGLVIYAKVPGTLGKMLDKRSGNIRSDLEEARRLREEAQSVLASYERKAREVQTQADKIVAAAKRDAEVAAEKAKEDLQVSIARRLKAADEHIASAEAQALRDVKHRAVAVAVAAAGDVLSKQFTAKDRAALIDSSLGEVESLFN